MSRELGLTEDAWNELRKSVLNYGTASRFLMPPPANSHRDEAEGNFALLQFEMNLEIVNDISTSGELRSRTERMHRFGSLEEVGSALEGLAKDESHFVRILQTELPAPQFDGLEVSPTSTFFS